MRLQEIEDALIHFKVCPKCNSKQGFWFGLKFDHAYVHCKGCGEKFELFEIYKAIEGKKGSQRLRFFRK